LLHLTVWGADERDAALLVHGSLSWGEDSWREQRPLADRERLLVVDRRGFGDSPGPDVGDWESDAADLANLLDGEPMHLVGHSYGGVSALLAAARCPECVRSLTVVEPPALGLVRGDDAVEEFIDRVDAAKRDASDPLDYYRRFLAAFGLSTRAQRLNGKGLRAAASSWRERPPSDAEIPLDTIRSARIPTLIVRGAWDSTPADALGRRALHPVCDELVERLGAENATFAGAAHSPQLLGAPFNERLRAFWDSVSY
jgi:pimeloyl-ACP methyl ester carboxylesterase